MWETPLTDLPMTDWIFFEVLISRGFKSEEKVVKLGGQRGKVEGLS